MKRSFLQPPYKRQNSVLRCLCRKQRVLAILICMAAALAAHSQDGEKPLRNRFEVISRHSLAVEKTGLPGSSTDHAELIKTERRGNKQLYTISTGAGTASVEALSNIEYSAKANRVVTYGDNLDRHVVSKAYVNMYSGTGTLIKSFGLVASSPFTATLNDNGSFIIAGNKNLNGEGLSLFLAKFDKNGNKQWEKKIADENPVAVYSAANEKYISLVTFKPGATFTNIHYYDGTGNLVYTDASHISVAAVEFIPNDRVVVSTGTSWQLYDIKKGFKLLASGQLAGKTIGRYPITADASGKLFTVVSEAGDDVRLQAFDTETGAVKAESVFNGKAFWVPTRLVKFSPDGTIQFKTPQEQVVLKLKQ